ncbi:hypothetical protein Tco_0898646 [Tanacetum coccineum]
MPTPTQFSSSGEEQAQHVQQIHSQVRARIEQQNQKYKERADTHRKRVVFREGDLVWIRLGKERFPAGRFGKLQPRADGPFRVLKKINDNAYKIDLPGTYNVSATFNVADLSPYVTDTEDNEEITYTLKLYLPVPQIMDDHVWCQFILIACRKIYHHERIS